MKTKGFTLFEIMIVVIIIGMMSVMAIPAFQEIRENKGRQRVETVKVEAPVIAGNPVEAGNPRFTYEKQNYISVSGLGIKSVILVTDKVTGKQFLMIEDFGTADLNVVKIEASSRFGR